MSIHRPKEKALPKGRSDPWAVTAAYEQPAAAYTPRPKVLLVREASGSDSFELQTLLRRRLRWIALAASMASALASLQKLLSFDFTGSQSVAALIWSWPDLRLSVLYTFAYGALTAFLYRNVLPTLFRLRLYELLIFTGGAVSCGVNNWYVLNTGGWLGQLIGLNHLNLLAGALSISWFFLIVAYGTLIPNTGRRCAAAVGSMTVLGLGLTARSLVSNSVAPPEFVRFLLQMGIWLALAAGIALIGSHRLETLRQAAYAARQLGQYRLKQRLGQGGMGEVYLAEHQLLRRPCAIKIIRPERAGNEEDLIRFEREVQATATLSHPNTVQIYDYGRADDGTFYYVMEFLPGLTLEQLVERHGPLPPARTIHFLRQVCDSLREAHAIGLIHRDVKPANIMVCQRGEVFDVAKLLDFGLAQRVGRRTSDVTQDGMLTGTPAYMSPEQVAGADELDARSDLYCVGALGFFLLTGQAPFAGRSLAGTLAAQRYETPTPLSQLRADVPRDLEAVLMRCLAKLPAERFADAGILLDALAACDVTAWSSEDARRWWQSESEPLAGLGGRRGT